MWSLRSSFLPGQSVSERGEAAVDSDEGRRRASSAARWRRRRRQGRRRTRRLEHGCCWSSGSCRAPRRATPPSVPPSRAHGRAARARRAACTRLAGFARAAPRSPARGGRSRTATGLGGHPPRRGSASATSTPRRTSLRSGRAPRRGRGCGRGGRRTRAPSSGRTTRGRRVRPSARDGSARRPWSCQGDGTRGRERRA